MELVTLTSIYSNGIAANLLKHKLDNNGIACVLVDENMVGLYPMYDPALGGIKIKVRKEDYEKALAILNEEIAEE